MKIDLRIGSVPYRNILYGVVKFVHVDKSYQVEVGNIIHFVDMDGNEFPIVDNGNRYRVTGIVHEMIGLNPLFKTIVFEKEKFGDTYES